MDSSQTGEESSIGEPSPTTELPVGEAARELGEPQT
jgi:hypothetical protein